MFSDRSYGARMAPLHPSGPPARLPRGHHGLPRRFVIQSQRSRVIAAVADVVAEKGYQAMTVADITAHAGVSRKTFYELFRDKHDCFLVAYETVAKQLVDTVAASYAKAGSWPEGVAAGLAAFLDTLAAEPSFARMCIVEVLAAGPEAVKRRDAVMGSFASYIAEGARQPNAGEATPPATAEAIVGAIHGVVQSRILQDRTKELPSLAPDLLYLVLSAYLGRAEAQRQLDRLMPAGAERGGRR